MNAPRQHGPIPLFLEEHDRKWLRDEAASLGVKSSDVAAFLIRAARFSGLAAYDIGSCLSKRDFSSLSRNLFTEELAEEADRRIEQEEKNPLFDALEQRQAEQAAPIPAPKRKMESDGYTEDDNWQPVVKKPNPVAPLAQPQAFIGRHGARPDIVQMHQLGSLTAPAGMRDEFMRDYEQPGDAAGNLVRRNYAHLRNVG